MTSNPVLFSTLMQLPESERFEIAMAVLDQSSPSAVTEDEITLEAAKRQDELESAVVRDIGYDELLDGFHCSAHGPRAAGGHLALRAVARHRPGGWGGLARCGAEPTLRDQESPNLP